MNFDSRELDVRHDVRQHSEVIARTAAHVKHADWIELCDEL